ncbi:tryptophan synthase subunit alpha [Neobacillus sp. LXY-1]|uniref:tryptophan synthase subunit alpha n=1 Tax=Neobacillus sp. LXY-1 TaxID=3379133 RepID=UPI003EDFD682
MNRIERAFQVLNETKGKAFVPYIMAGDGGLENLVKRLSILEECGATAIEVGVPFSDPVADGPTIQLAGIRALEHGTTLKGIIAAISQGRDKISIPIILMTYLNPVYAYGIESFIEDIKKAGVDGCIIPDLPMEEEDLIAPHLEKVGIELIRLATLTTPIERIKQLASNGRGFLYTVTVKGITGTRNEFDHELYSFLKRVKEVSPIPVLAGFGISNAEQVKELTKYCDGVVVGSKIVDLFTSNQLDELASFMTSYKQITHLA